MPKLRILLLRWRRWMERAFRARRFAAARRPAWDVPPCVAGASCFDFLHANPLAALQASRLAWVDEAACATGWLRARARSLQAAFNDLDSARARLGFERMPLGADAARADLSALSSLERERRGLELEGEALCLLARAAKRRFEGLAFDADGPHPALGEQSLLGHYVGARCLEAVEMLLGAGADPEAPRANGDTPLALAALKARSLDGGACARSRDARAILGALEAQCLRSRLPGAPKAGAPRI